MDNNSQEGSGSGSTHLPVSITHIEGSSPTAQEVADHTEREKEMGRRNLWELNLTITFPVDPEDVKLRYSGDAEIDFANRAFDRVRSSLINCLKLSDKGFNYYNAKMPNRVFD
jgi:hypothetical protein